MQKEKNDLIKTFNLSKSSFDKLTRWSNERSISRSAALRILINEHCHPLRNKTGIGG
jgi:hypothetical protein